MGAAADEPSRPRVRTAPRRVRSRPKFDLYIFAIAVGATARALDRALTNARTMLRELRDDFSERFSSSGFRPVPEVVEEPGWLAQTFGPFWQRTEEILTRPPAGFGIAASALLVVGALGYGAIAGNHVAALLDWCKDMRDAAANAGGFRIAEVSLSGEKEVSREEVLTTAGVTGRASLLFLDATAARARLMANPWISDAAVLKLYPDRLQVTVTERQAFALWQKDGHVSVIASDGTVLEPYLETRYVDLPLVVGRGAQRQAKEFLTLVDRYPDIRTAVRASILVAERRWNLRLRNGIDVRLPETDVAQALERLVALDHDKKLLSRDIVMVDLRLPDRVTVRLSAAAAQAREEAFKDTKKKKGGDA